jgi:hypothetical protein
LEASRFSPPETGQTSKSLIDIESGWINTVYMAVPTAYMGNSCGALSQIDWESEVIVKIQNYSEGIQEFPKN